MSPNYFSLVMTHISFLKKIPFTVWNAELDDSMGMKTQIEKAFAYSLH